MPFHVLPRPSTPFHTLFFHALCSLETDDLQRKRHTYQDMLPNVLPLSTCPRPTQLGEGCQLGSVLELSSTPGVFQLITLYIYDTL